MRNKNLRLKVALGVLVAVMAAGCSTGASSGSSGSGTTASKLSGNTTNGELRVASQKAIAGHTLAFVPLGLGSPLWDEWSRVIGTNAKAAGFTYVVKDSASSATKQADIVQTLVNQLKAKDVLVVHNADVAVTAKLLQQAEAKGIYVISLNQASNWKGDAFVGGDIQAIGEKMGDDNGKVCSSGSGKVAVLRGVLASGFDIDLLKGLKKSFKKYPKIKIVADQATQWNRSTGHDVMATILQQHPDLCASAEDWDQVSYGTGTAVKEAGLQDKVKVFATDSSIACKGIKEGLIHQSYSFNPTQQGVSVVSLAAYLVQSGRKAGETRTAEYSLITTLNKSNIDQSGACYDGKGGSGLS
jgi:ribose transport system substrate-binding protein